MPTPNKEPTVRAIAADELLLWVGRQDKWVCLTAVQSKNDSTLTLSTATIIPITYYPRDKTDRKGSKEGICPSRFLSPPRCYCTMSVSLKRFLISDFLALTRDMHISASPHPTRIPPPRQQAGGVCLTVAAERVIHTLV